MPTESTLRLVAGAPTATPIEFGWLDRHPSSVMMVATVVLSSLAVGVASAIRPVIGIGLTLALALGFIVLRRPAAGGYLLVGLVPIISGLRTGFPIPGFRLSQLLIGVIGVTILVTATARQSIRWRALDWMMLLYCLSALIIGGLNNIHLGTPLSSSIGTLFGPFQYFILYRAVATALPLRAQRTVALRLVLLASIPVSLLALLQQLRINGINSFIATMTGSSIFQSGAYHYFARATGPWDHWTPLAGYLLVVMLVGISLLLNGVKGVLSPRAMLAVLAFAAAGMLLSAELSAMIALIGGSLVLGVWAGKLRLLLRWALPIVVILAIAFGSFFAQRLNTEFGASTGTGRSTLVPQTIDYRFHIWSEQYFPAIAQRELTGYGTGLPSSISWPDSESEYVTELMWGGIPLLMIFVGLMWAFFARARSMSRPKGDEPARWAIARMMTVLVVLLMVIDLVFPYFTSSGLPQAMFAVLGILLATDRTSSPAPTPADSFEALSRPETQLSGTRTT